MSRSYNDCIRWSSRLDREQIYSIDELKTKTNIIFSTFHLVNAHIYLNINYNGYLICTY